MPVPFLLLMVSLPPNPSSRRVKVWRRLRALGAVALKRSVYLLPATKEHHEQFLSLAQEIQQARGEATLVRVERIETMSTAEVIRLFQEARDRDYQELTQRCRTLLRALCRKKRSPDLGVELARIERDARRVHDMDFFDAPGRRELERLQEAVAARLGPEGARVPPPAGRGLGDVGGRRWATRPRPHVDRIASAWLIKRFIDREATFLFAEPSAFPSDAVPFDAPGAELGHHGSDCTFETLLKRAGLRDRRLHRLAEVVHEADLRDGKFPREEARGIDLAARGLLAALEDDHEVLASGLTLFDGLYAAIGARG